MTTKLAINQFKHCTTAGYFIIYLYLTMDLKDQDPIESKQLLPKKTTAPVVLIKLESVWEPPFNHFIKMTAIPLKLVAYGPTTTSARLNLSASIFHHPLEIFCS